MDGSIALLFVLLVGFIVLGFAAVVGGVDSRELDTRRAPTSWIGEGD
jgi:hypothetical protein